MNEVIKLITYTETKDALLQVVKTPVYREVYAEEKPIHSNEFFRAGQNNIKPRVMFEVHTHEYEGEEDLRHGGAVYHIYRTFKNVKTGRTELYCEVRIGLSTDPPPIEVGACKSLVD